MRCPRCNAALEEGSVFCGNCGAQVTPVHGRDETVLTGSETLRQDEISSNWPDAGSGRTSQGQTQRTALASFGQQTSSVPLPLTNKPVRNTPPPLAPRHWLMRNVLIVLVALVLIAGGTGVVLVLTHHTSGGGSATPTAAGVSPSGQVAFFDNPNSTAGNTDALSISVAHLSVLPAGSSYDVWLVNEQNEQITSLGKLTSNGAVFTLNFVSGENGTQAHLNLLGVGNKIEVTEEQGTVSVPGTHIILSADFPPRAFIHIRHLLFQFPVTPNNVGLLVGLLAQAQVLNNQAVLEQNLVAGTDNRAGVQCFAQSMIDISEGTHGANYRPLSTWCKTHYTRWLWDSGSEWLCGDGGSSCIAGGKSAGCDEHDSLARATGGNWGDEC